jgi:hypothetical protein
LRVNYIFANGDLWNKWEMDFPMFGRVKRDMVYKCGTIWVVIEESSEICKAFLILKLLNYYTYYDTIYLV